MTLITSTQFLIINIGRRLQLFLQGQKDQEGVHPPQKKDKFLESYDELERSSYSCKYIRIKKESTHQTNKERLLESNDEVEGSNYS